MTYKVLLQRDAHWRESNMMQDEIYFVLEGTGRIRVGEDTLTVPRYGAVLVWQICGAPRIEEGADRAAFYPEDPRQLPPELRDRKWPPE